MGEDSNPEHHLASIDGVLTTSIPELFDDLRIRASVADRAATASFNCFHRMYQFQSGLRLLAKIAVVTATPGVSLPLHQLRRKMMRNTTRHALSVHNIKTAWRVHRMWLVRTPIQRSRNRSLAL